MKNKIKNKMGLYNFENPEMKESQRNNSN